MDFWRNLFSGQGFMPRRYCGTWDTSLINLHIVSDTIIWLSYLWIPLVMVWSYKAHKKSLRVHTPLLLIVILYTVFITACGWTHFFDALMFYVPAYRINGVIRALTAIASLATAVSLVRLVPQAITAPITIVTQRMALHQQFLWLRDILDSATEGVLKLCETPEDLPQTQGSLQASTEIHSSAQLRVIRQAVRKVAEDADFTAARTDDILTALHEAAMNALNHAGGATIRIYAAPDRLQLWITDTGEGIPLDKLPIATLKQGYSTAGTAGQGWFLVLTFVDTAYLLTSTQGTTVVMEVYREPVRAPVPFSLAVGGDIATAA